MMICSIHWKVERAKIKCFYRIKNHYESHESALHRQRNWNEKKEKNERRKGKIGIINDCEELFTGSGNIACT